MVVYALMTILVQAFHEHHQGDPDDVPTPLAGCDDPGSHWAGHTHAPDLSPSTLPCASCQQRAESPCSLSSPLVFIHLRTERPADRPIAIGDPVAFDAFSSRGPPRV